MTTDAEVIVVGAGLAGLCCARQLKQCGVEPLILEGSDSVGGRVRTDLVDGFRLDRGFQILLSAYPEARAVLGYNQLELRPFYAGALVRVGGAFRRLADPWRRPWDALRNVVPRWTPATNQGTLGHGRLFCCGDHTTNASIQGAMVAGRHAADAVLKRL